jgi:anaerobic selenocysteine-containing dehydrogenase
MRDLDALTGRGNGDLASWAGAEYPFRLIGRRMQAHYNSGGMTAPRLQRAEPTNPAYLHPDDLAALGVREGDVLEITSARASILGVAAAEPTLRRGLVAMAHSWGDVEEHDDRVHEIGGNTGRLADVGDAFDPYSGQPLMSNLPVRVAARSSARDGVAAS